MRYVNKSIPDWWRPRLLMTASGVAWQDTCKNYATAQLSENKRERRKASEEAAGTVEREMHSHRGWYLKYRNNDWKGERPGRHNRTKESRYTYRKQSGRE